MFLLAVLAVVLGATNVGLITKETDGRQKLKIGRRQWGSTAPFAIMAAVSGVTTLSVLLGLLHAPFTAFLDSLPGAATATISGAETAVGLLLGLSAIYGYGLYYLAKAAEHAKRMYLEWYIDNAERAARRARWQHRHIVDFVDIVPEGYLDL